ncbi:troponin I type 2a (skeletal, fast), tandem duplicate 2 isoform X1 [Betta splendens]|uniref:Troponin I type 2a (Skeletal, fast), tandem duplicate 2 isoform X1 n=2 Tax=Betta splendens TaxID=158456 RepID=A0A9W2XVX5_BETSP|nr:troponin I type 2a (skeletal, fast), tandem duplicate 2 isoform X1 [Betta splendens]
MNEALSSHAERANHYKAWRRIRSLSVYPAVNTSSTAASVLSCCSRTRNPRFEAEDPVFVLIVFRQQQHPSANMADEKRLSARRKHTLKSCMLVVANTLLEAEAEKKAEERQTFLADKLPPLELPYSRDELLELCTKLHEQIDVSEEERYCIEFKLNMVLNEVRDLNIKIVDLRGKFKRPRLKKVRMSADAMLKALLGSKHTVNMDLRANLKQVKKEVKEEDKQLRDVGDWRKNIEDKSDRKKMFDS